MNWLLLIAVYGFTEWLFNFFPGFPTDYKTDHSLAYPIFFSQLDLVFASFSTVAIFFSKPCYLFCSKLGSSNLLSKRTVIAFLPKHIPNVIFLSPYKKMFWVYTERLIAFVKYKKPFWNSTIYYLPRYSVGQKCFISNSKPSISFQSTWSRCASFLAMPNPAFQLFRCINPKPGNSNFISKKAIIHCLSILIYTIPIISYSQADVPYMQRTADKDQDFGGLKNNFNELTNQGQSNTLRARDSVTGSNIPGDTCIDNPTFCVDATNHCVRMRACTITFSDGTVQTTAFTSTGTFAANTSTQTVLTSDFTGSNTTFGVCNATITMTSDGSPHRLIFSGHLTNDGSARTTSGTIFQDGAFISPFSQTIAMMRFKDGNGGNTSGADTSINYLFTPTVGNHSYCLAFKIDSGNWTVTNATRGGIFRVESAR